MYSLLGIIKLHLSIHLWGVGEAHRAVNYRLYSIIAGWVPLVSADSGKEAPDLSVQARRSNKATAREDGRRTAHRNPRATGAFSKEPHQYCVAASHK